MFQHVTWTDGFCGSSQANRCSVIDLVNEGGNLADL